MKILLGYIITFGYIISIMGITSVLSNKYHFKEELSRKLIHIFVGFSWFITVYFFGSSVHIIIPPILFTIINYISYKKSFIKSMERSTKKSYGTIFYALSFTILALITYIYHDFLPFYGIGALTMTIGDGLAPFFGSLLPNLKIPHSSKTYAGSLSVIIITAFILIIFNSIYSLGLSLILIIFLCVISSILELVDFFGIDNLTLPVGLAIIAYFIH